MNWGPWFIHKPALKLSAGDLASKQEMLGRNRGTLHKF
jgi:hypothetical protein